jgi:hypothetical protein
MGSPAPIDPLSVDYTSGSSPGAPTTPHPGTFEEGNGGPGIPQGMTPTGHAVSLQIQEGIADYNDFLLQTQRASARMQAESIRKQEQTKTEGIAAIKEMAMQAAYETKTAFMGAELASSAQEAKLGASGVRASGSPLLAAQQVSDVAWGAAAEKGRQAAAGISLGGLKLGGTLQDIREERSLLSAEYEAKVATAARKKRALAQAAPGLVSAADTGQIIDWTKSVLSIGLGFL